MKNFYSKERNMVVFILLKVDFIGLSQTIGDVDFWWLISVSDIRCSCRVMPHNDIIRRQIMVVSLKTPLKHINYHGLMSKWSLDVARQTPKPRQCNNFPHFTEYFMSLTTSRLQQEQEKKNKFQIILFPKCDVQSEIE